MQKPPSPLNDPRTVLHVLSYKAALPIFLALLMSDCPKPVDVSWLMRRTGTRTRGTAYDSLEFLQELDVVFKAIGRNGVTLWSLTSFAAQLPLPISYSLLLETQSAQSELPTYGSTQSHIVEGTQLQRPVTSQVSAQQTPDISVSENQTPKISRVDGQVSTKCTHPLNDVVDVDHSNHLLQKHHQQHDAVSQVSENQTPAFSDTPTSVFLRDIGLDDPVPDDYADYPLASAVGYWWFSLVKKMKSPQGYLRRRMECGHVRPTEKFLELAVSWLALSDVQRFDLWGEAESAVSWGRNASIQMPDDFPFVPYAPLIRLAATKHKAEDGEFPFIPDSIAWDDYDGYPDDDEE